jgi:hypothetical protein
MFYKSYLDFFAHLSWRLKWAFLITRCLASVCLSVCPSVNFYILDFFSRTTGPILTRLGTNHPWVKGIQVCSKEGDSPSPRGDNSQIQSNLVQIVLEWGEFKFVQIKGQVLFKGEIITKIGLGHLKIFFLQNHWANFNQTWHKSSLGKGDLSLLKKRGDNPSPRGDNSKRVKMHWQFLEIFSRTRRPNVIELGTNYPWVKGIQVCSNKGPGPLQMADHHKNGVWSFKNLLLPNHWANFNQTWHKLSFGEGD